MTRAEYMRQLESLLSSVPDSEREEALQYYNDYFDDASDQEDDEVIKSLGSPEELAESIKAGLSDDGNQGMFTEDGFKTSEVKKDELGTFTGVKTYARYSKAEKESAGYSEKDNDEMSDDERKKSNDRVVLMVILAVIASPFIISIIATVFGIATGLIGTVIGIAAGFVGVVIALMVSSVALFVTGVIGISQISLMAGLCLIGAGLLCTSASIFSIWLAGMAINMAKKAIPYIWEGFLWVVKKLIGLFKKEEMAK